MGGNHWTISGIPDGIAPVPAALQEGFRSRLRIARLPPLAAHSHRNARRTVVAALLSMGAGRLNESSGRQASR